MIELTKSRAEALAAIVLGHVTQPFPHKLDHILTGADDDVSPKRLHPLFFGSFDWHSCVHGYWSLARLLRRHGPKATRIVGLFDRQFTPAKVAGEVAYFERPSAVGFERPYGWAWLLALAAELEQHRERNWASALRPLTTLIRDRFVNFLPLATYPIRGGTHGNTAFALLLAADYADALHDDAFLDQLRTKAQAWYGRDRACQAWEPGGDDFLSPALIEAACMERLLPRAAFGVWFDGFLPDLAAGQPHALFVPAVVSDRADGKLSHLDGLNLSRAWCWRRLAAALDPADPRRPLLLASADEHLAATLDNLDTTYMGAHWLATFALLALDQDTGAHGEDAPLLPSREKVARSAG